MSAIWGQVRFNGMAGNEIDIMQKPYERKCKLDRLGRVNAGCCSMGCGIQYITKEAQYEQLPYELYAHKGTQRWLIREALIDYLNPKKDMHWNTMHIFFESAILSFAPADECTCKSSEGSESKRKGGVCCITCPGYAVR